MSSKDTKFYVCVRTNCTFKTDKRKAIYTHLVRTHSERKEDYECEYCSTIFQNDAVIEHHLQEHHPSQPFTYTCVSRIENVISKCAKLGQERRRSQTAGQTGNDTKSRSSDVMSAGGRPTPDKSLHVKAENEHKNGSVKKKTNINLKPRTKASVNASLHNIAKNAITNGGESMETSETVDGMYGADCENDDDDNYSMHTTKPSGLKIKLNLKKIAECSNIETLREKSKSPPLLEPEVDVESYDVISPTPPDIVHSKPYSSGVAIREKASKYFDKLEVYHSTDEFGRRCCPFCTYKTTKNTIRVHLSGIHKIHFVKCSLCDYKAAFPHQITQHGMKFHKTTNLNVIQLSKESREKVIALLPKSAEFEQQFLANKQLAEATEPEPIIENDNSNCSFIDDVISSESGSPSEEEDNVGEAEADVSRADEERSFKPPKCQTSKTDYYSIQIENGVYLYCCNLCSFQTPVRATIYTHKYRHEEKSYRCGHCQFTSSPRSNVVHHCRSKHKHQAIKVIDGGEMAWDDAKDMSQLEAEQSAGTIRIKQEPVDDLNQSDISSRSLATFENSRPPSDIPKGTKQQSGNSPNKAKSSPTIIKVPEFKRTFTSVAYNPVLKKEDSKKRKACNPSQAGYKLSLNKLYRINPVGSPKYLCAKCPYACDTHPKMKHHLYRHRPQQYKCPYCDHRKYPRSYVVRHVRDTHRGKPLRVIDLSKGNEPIDLPEDIDDVTDGLDGLDDPMDSGHRSEVNTDLEESMNMYIQQELKQIEDISNNNVNTLGPTVKSEPAVKSEPVIKSEPMEQDEYDTTCPPGGDTSSSRTASSVTTPPSYKSLADKLKLNLSKDFSDKMFSESPDVSPNFSETVYTSTPLIESIINNGQFPASPKLPTKNFEKKKSLKDYRINSGRGPRYVCNKCGYGTENYKTIHNHMYRHESQRYQCPYCGYRRSPRSFVENHIREVHKGNPVIVTELTEDLDVDAPLGSPRQCVNGKRKSPFHPALSSSTKKHKAGNSAFGTPKTHMKWPAPKPASKVLSAPEVSTPSPQLQIPVKQKVSTSDMAPPDEKHVSSQRFENSPANTDISDVQKTSEADSLSNNHSASGDSENDFSEKLSSPFRFKEGCRTTFKTMYKCVFDSETCNHISKDKSKMKQHLFMHVEYKPWTCDFCDMTASQSSHIKNHVRIEHPGASDMSFKYKRHNYLEKHIEGFLTKGLFTVPVGEFRRIMDLKGNTKTTQKCTFARDAEGFILCPYCDYKTKSGGMTDHVKMKHMQPRFKCHWCDYRAFYRSEVRKHHRKEKSHSGHEFKTQELDLSQLLSERDDVSEESSSIYLETNEENFLNENSQADPEFTYYSDDNEGNDDDEDDLDEEEELLSNCSSPREINSFNNVEQMLSPEVLNANSAAEQPGIDNVQPDIKQEPFESVHVGVGLQNVIDAPKVFNTEVGEDGSMKIVKVPKLDPENLMSKGNKFQCGYCSFSATLRVKVKMHCSKKHSDKVLKVLEPSAMKTGDNVRENSSNITRVDANDWKGTKFEKDLMKAGVSKLNLTSLFAKSKRLKVDEEILSDNDEEETDMDVEEMSAENTGAVEHQQHHLTIPFKKASAPRKIEIPVARNIQCGQEQEPEFKIPLTPCPVIKVADKSPALKKTKAKSESYTSDQNVVLKDSQNRTVLKQDSLSLHILEKVTTETEEGFSYNSEHYKDSVTCNNESHDGMDIIVEPLESVQSKYVGDAHLYDKDTAKDKTTEVNSEVENKGAEDVTAMEDNMSRTNAEISENSTNENHSARLELATPDLVILKTMPNLTPVVLENETFDYNQVSKQNQSINDIKTGLSPVLIETTEGSQRDFQDRITSEHLVGTIKVDAEFKSPGLGN